MTLGIRWSRDQKFTVERRAIPIMGLTKRAGRPRKTNVVRDASGKSRGEIVDFSVVLNQPHRRGVSKEHRKSELLGYALGRLRFIGEISEDQLRAGNEWAELVRSYAATIGLPHGSPQSGSLLSDSGKPAYSFSRDEATHDADSEQKRSASLKSRYDECYETMIQIGHTLSVGRKVLIVTRQVCIQDQDPQPWEVGDLRLGLNAMARIFKIGERTK